MPAGEASPERALEEREALLRLHRCLLRLPENRRVAFVLCGIEEMSPQDAAKLVGTSPGSMRARYMHARRELARMLGVKLKEGSDVRERASALRVDALLQLGRFEQAAEVAAGMCCVNLRPTPVHACARSHQIW